MMVWGVRGVESSKMRPWAQIIRRRGKTRKHPDPLRHVEGTFPQTDADLVTAGIRIDTSNINQGEVQKGNTFNF